MSMVLDFFDVSKKCPPEITDCENLRNIFLKEKHNLRDYNCAGCEEATLKSRYIDIILNNKRTVEPAHK